MSGLEQSVRDVLEHTHLEVPEISEAEIVLEAMAQVFGREPPQVLRSDAIAIVGDADAVLDAGATAHVAIDESGVIRGFDAAAERLFGAAASDVLGRPAETILSSGGDAPADGVPQPFEGRARDGGTIPLRGASSTLEIDGRRLRLLSIRTPVALEPLEEARRKAEARYRSLVEQIPAVTFMGSLREDRIELYVSPQIQSLLGFSQEEWLSDPFLWYRQLHPEDRESCNREFARGCQTGGPFRADFRALTRGGDVVWVHGEARVVRDEHGFPQFIQGVAYDITEAKRAEEALRAYATQIQASLAEKEVLLKEIHHRVKNNLQVISSLLRLQSAYVADPRALELFVESRHRIQSMALVHEKLYQSGNLSRIDFGGYLRSLAELLLRSYESAPGRIRLDVDIEEAFLDIDVALPLGLVVNELVTNSLKYAFPAGRGGTIRVALQERDDDRWQLVVADDGAGLPDSFDLEKSETLGLQLVSALAQQLGGDVELGRSPGAEFRLRFPR